MISSFLCSINGAIVCLYEVVTTELFVNDGERDVRVAFRRLCFSASSAAATKSSSDASAKYEIGSGGGTDLRPGDFD